MMYWTPEMDDKLKADFVRIGSLRGVAREWGFTANQIIGRAQRISLTAYDRKKAESERFAPMSVPKKRAATLGRSVKMWTPKAVPVAEMTSTPPATISKAPDCAPMDFLAEDDVRGRCRYAVEDRPTIMCGAPVKDGKGAWCTYHRGLVYVPVPKRYSAARAIHAAGYLATQSMPATMQLMPAGW